MRVVLKLLNSGIVQVWFQTEKSPKEYKSFSVIEDSVEKVESLNVLESPQCFEIYSGELIVRINKEPFQIRFYDKYQKLLLEDYQDKGFVKEDNIITCYKSLRSDEQFFGLGEKTGSFNRRGKSYRMWNSDKPCYSNNEDPLYKSIPFFMSNYGFGIFFDNTYKTEFKFGSESNQYFSFGAPGGEMIYYFIFGPDYKQIIQQYTQLTGKPIMPPAWGLGFSQSRGLLTNENLTRQIATEYRSRKIPCDIIYQDIGWVQELQNFEWRKQNYENPEQMVSNLKQRGFKIIVSQDPVISQLNIIQWHEADSLGYFITDIRNGKAYDMPWPWGGNCGLVDFTKPGVDEWWGLNQQKVLNDGVRGFWTDMGEPAWCNEESTDRLNMKHYLGMHNSIHNVYGLTWAKAVTEQFERNNPNKRIFQMTRSGFAGMQRYTFAWSGDSGDGNDVNNGWNKLANQLQTGISAGLGLIPFWSCDISGYCGDIMDYQSFRDLYVRWMQFGIFNPISRVHHEGNNAVEPWLFGPQAESICRKVIELKYKLHPYLYTYAREAYDKGLPIMRAMLLEYPDDTASMTLESQFMFGKEILVAPVVEKDAVTKKVYLPEGQWIDFNDGRTVYQGNKWITYPAPLDVIPIFVKKGSIIPMMPVMQFIDQNPEHPIILDIYPATENNTATFNLYEDDGETNDYKKDIYCKTPIKCLTTRNSIELNIQQREENGYRPSTKRFYFIKMHFNQKPETVSIGPRKVKLSKTDLESKKSSKTLWYWDKETHICFVGFPDNGNQINISIKKL